MNGASIDFPDFVKLAIDQVVKSSKCSANPDITFSRGSQAGDGYTSKTVAITIKDGEKLIPIFLKYFPEGVQKFPMITIIFEQETNFYENIYPIFKAFQRARGVRKPFDNVPKYYKTKTNNEMEPVVLENLRARGYTLRNSKQRIDDDHVRLVLKTFAKFHAVSFALKDQDPELFTRLCNSTTDLLPRCMEEAGISKALTIMVDQIAKNLVQEDNKVLLEFCTDLDKNLISFCSEIDKLADGYSAITQGDCWSNNMMFLYNKDNTVADVKLVDWQITRVHSPVSDVSYFFYSVATETMMQNVETYKNFYHDALSQSISDLGSDPDTLYPYEVFQHHWKTFSKFGLAMSFSALKIMLCEHDEVVNIYKNNESGTIACDEFAKTIKDQDEYQRRMKAILQHFLDNKLL